MTLTLRKKTTISCHLNTGSIYFVRPMVLTNWNFITKNEIENDIINKLTPADSVSLELKTQEAFEVSVNTFHPFRLFQNMKIVTT